MADCRAAWHARSEKYIYIPLTFWRCHRGIEDVIYARKTVPIIEKGKRELAIYGAMGKNYKHFMIRAINFTIITITRGCCIYSSDYRNMPSLYGPRRGNKNALIFINRRAIFPNHRSDTIDFTPRPGSVSLTENCVISRYRQGSLDYV